MKTFEKIFTVVAKIPKGKVMTYGQIAKVCHIHDPRIVGFAMHANKRLHKIPCHRVVGAHGKLTGYAMGGIQRKKEILENEGVMFVNEQTVDLSKSAFLDFSKDIEQPNFYNDSR